MHKSGVWPSQQAHSPSQGCPEEDRPHRPPSTSSHSYEQNRNTGHTAHLVPSKDEMSQFLKLKEEVTKRPQGYIQRRVKHIARSLTPDHEVVKCLVAFIENALKYAAEVLAIIEWGTQHWKLQKSFPVPHVLRWLQTLELIQRMMPLRGELPLIPSGAHLEDIRIRSPTMWAWIAILLQYWQDHMSRQLYGGTSGRPVTWQIPSSMTSTCGCPIVYTLGGTMWPPMPPCGWTCETSSWMNTTRNGKARSC